MHVHKADSFTRLSGLLTNCNLPGGGNEVEFLIRVPCREAREHLGSRGFYKYLIKHDIRFPESTLTGSTEILHWRKQFGYPGKWDEWISPDRIGKGGMRLERES